MTAGIESTMLATPIDDGDHILGPRTALVTLVEYGDYECGWCQQFDSFIQDLRKQYGDRLCYVYRHFVMAWMHPCAQNAAEAAEAAGAQGRFWEMHSTLFKNQGHLENGYLVEYADMLKLDVTRFLRDMAGHAYAEKVRDNHQGGVRSGVNSTPTFYINGVRYDHAWSEKELLVTIEQAAQAAEAGQQP